MTKESFLDWKHLSVMEIVIIYCLSVILVATSVRIPESKCVFHNIFIFMSLIIMLVKTLIVWIYRYKIKHWIEDFHVNLVYILVLKNRGIILLSGLYSLNYLIEIFFLWSVSICGNIEYWEPVKWNKSNSGHLRLMVFQTYFS